MRKQITLAIVAALFGLAITFAAIAGLAITFREVVVTTNADVIHPTEVLSAFDARRPLGELIPSRTAAETHIEVEPTEELLPMANPYLPVRELDPVY
jgi:hypothetical protein